MAKFKDGARRMGVRAGYYLCDWMVDLLFEKEVEDYFDNYFDFKYSLEELLGREIDLLEEQTIKNPYLKKNVDATKTLIYG